MSIKKWLNPTKVNLFIFMLSWLCVDHVFPEIMFQLSDNKLKTKTRNKQWLDLRPTLQRRSISNSKSLWSSSTHFSCSRPLHDVAFKFTVLNLNWMLRVIDSGKETVESSCEINKYRWRHNRIACLIFTFGGVLNHDKNAPTDFDTMHFSPSDYAVEIILRRAVPVNAIVWGKWVWSLLFGCNNRRYDIEFVFVRHSCECLSLLSNFSRMKSHCRNTLHGK